VLKFNAAGPDSLVDRKAPGQPSRLTAVHRAALVEAVERGPDPAVQGVVRWRVIDLVHWLAEEFTVRVSKQTLSRELRKLGYRKLSAHPRHHAQAPDAIEAFKKREFGAELDKVRARLPRGKPIEIWFADEARVGQKNKITRRRAKRGTWPVAPHDQRTKSACIFGAICPQEGKAAGLVLPFLQYRHNEPAFGGDLLRRRRRRACRRAHGPGRLAPDAQAQDPRQYLHHPDPVEEP
jgi:transposase